MPIPPKLTVKLSAVTPLFLGGADPNDHAELRPPSIKGLLRYWYRALDGDYRVNEKRYFGSTDADAGQSPCLLRIDDWKEGTERWEGRRSRTEQGKYHRPCGQGGFQEGQGAHTKNGIVYLGYSLVLPPNDRKAVPAGTTFTLTIQPRPGHDSPEMRRAWLAALWLLVHIGGVGARSRRGLGSLRIEEWDGWPEAESLPLACRAANPEEWHARANQGLGRLLQSWFPRRPVGDHTTLAKDSLLVLKRGKHSSWEQALDDAGRELQGFRQRRQPDYDMVKAHLTPTTARKPLTAAPERVGFGLPLTFRYSSLNGASITFNDMEYDRHASPLFIGVARLGDHYHATFAHLLTPAVASGNAVRTSDGPGNLPVPPAAGTIVGQFMDQVRRQGVVGVKLP